MELALVVESPLEKVSNARYVTIKVPTCVCIRAREYIVIANDIYTSNTLIHAHACRCTWT